MLNIPMNININIGILYLFSVDIIVNSIIAVIISIMNIMLSRPILCFLLVGLGIRLLYIVLLHHSYKYISS